MRERGSVLSPTKASWKGVAATGAPEGGTGVASDRGALSEETLRPSPAQEQVVTGVSSP